MTAHRSTLLSFIVAAHRQGVLARFFPKGVTAREITGRLRHPAASSRELRMLETQGYLRGEGWPKNQRRYSPTLRGLRTSTAQE